MPELQMPSDVQAEAAEFRRMAEAIAGERWRTQLPPMIGKCRTQVWEYASGKRPPPASVKRLMRVMVAMKEDRPAGRRKS